MTDRGGRWEDLEGWQLILVSERSNEKHVWSSHEISTASTGEVTWQVFAYTNLQPPISCPSYTSLDILEQFHSTTPPPCCPGNLAVLNWRSYREYYFYAYSVCLSWEKRAIWQQPALDILGEDFEGLTYSSSSPYRARASVGEEIKHERT